MRNSSQSYEASPARCYLPLDVSECTPP